MSKYLLVYYPWIKHSSVPFDVRIDCISVSLLPVCCLYILFAKDMLIFRTLVNNNIRSPLCYFFRGFYNWNLLGVCNIYFYDEIFRSSRVRILWSLLEVVILKFIQLGLLLLAFKLQQNWFLLLKPISRTSEAAVAAFSFTVFISICKIVTNSLIRLGIFMIVHIFLK